jgi:hypothetical protein
LELHNSFAGLAQLLTKLVHLLAQFVNFQRRGVEELVDLVDNVTSKASSKIYVFDLV